MKGVIWKIEDKKSTVLFTNGDFRVIRTPEGAEIGTVIAVNYNRKALYMLTGIAALLLIFACVGAVSYFSPAAYIDITYQQKKGNAADTQVIVELAVNRYGRIVAVRSFSAGGTLVVHSLSLQHQKMEAGYAAIVREGSSLPKSKPAGKAQIAVTIAQKDLEKAETLRGLLLKETAAIEADTGYKLSVTIDVYQIKKNL
jgi:hypothetical protein